MAKGYIVTYKRTPKRKYDFAERQENAERIAKQYKALGYRRVTITPVT